jgi:hypothetical protein
MQLIAVSSLHKTIKKSEFHKKKKYQLSSKQKEEWKFSTEDVNKSLHISIVKM